MDIRTAIAHRCHARTLVGWALAWVVACVLSQPAWADEGVASLQAQVENLLKQQPMPQNNANAASAKAEKGEKGEKAQKRQPWRVEVTLGQLDPRIRLAPCERVKAYLPNGAQLWGRTRVGLRCEQGSVRWNVYWPVQVKVWAQALVATVPLRPGSLVEPSDVALAEVDIAASNSPVLSNPAEVVGRAVSRAIAPGQGLHQDDVKARRWFAIGDPVRLNVKGPGFMVAAEGVALTPGDEGRCARVRTDQGRVLCGQPVGDRLVEVTL